MSVISIYADAQFGRKIALAGLQQRKNAGEAVGRGHKLPALDVSGVDNLFKTAFPNFDEMVRAA